MGGRGSSFGVEIIAAVSPYGSQDAEIQELNVAGMTPMDRGSRFTNAEKTLDYLERKKLQETREQVQVLDDYGYVTRAFQGDEHSCAVDDKTQQYARGKIVTHNHPSEYGGTFSDADISFLSLATVYKGNIIKNLIMDCQSYTKYRPNETTGGIFVSWRRKEELPTGA